MADFDFGFVCVDEEGAAERHSFGKGAFGPEQEFDTLVQCKKCMGLDSEDVHGGSAAQKLVVGMQTEVEELGKEMRALAVSVNKIEVQEKAHPRHRATAPSAPSVPVTSAAVRTHRNTRGKTSLSEHRARRKAAAHAKKAKAHGKQRDRHHRVNLLEKSAVTEERRGGRAGRVGRAAASEIAAQTAEPADADEPSFAGLEDIAKNLEGQANAVESLTASFKQDADSDEAQGNVDLGAGLS